jgi:branched-chain amino acid transport system substrate-binding protein
MRRRTITTSPFAALAAALVALGGLVGCASTDRPATDRPAPIRLGTMAPLSGSEKGFGRAITAAQELAVKDINATGGVLGRQVELVVADDACDPATAVLAARKQATSDITVTVGGGCSSATVPTVKIFSDAGIPMIVPCSNSMELLLSGSGNVFMLAGSVDAEARFTLAAMRRLGTKRLTVIHDGTSYSESLAMAAVGRATAASVTIAAQLKLSQGATSFRRIAEEAIASTPDAVFFTGFTTEAHQLILDLRGAGYTGSIVGGDAIDSGAELIQGLTPAQAANVYRTTFSSPDFQPELAGWSAHYLTATGNAPIDLQPEAYDAVTLAVDAIRRAGTLDRAAVRQAIATTTDLKLLSGSPRFNPDGSRVTPRFILLRTKNGSFTIAADSATEDWN